MNGFRIIEIFENELINLSPEWIKEKFDIEI